jgi:hypothetical protein
MNITRKMADKINQKFQTHKSTIGKRKSKISSLIHTFTHPLIHFFIQNKPNPSSASERQATKDERQIVQNEPNLIWPETKDERREMRTLQILPPTFVYIYLKKLKKLQKIRNFYNFLKQTYLSTYISNAYKTFCQGIRFSLHEIRVTKNAKQTQFQMRPTDS